jgi:hypothetical protein
MRRNILSTHLESKDLINTQQMEVAVNGPDGATHLILCTGIANISSYNHESFTFFVGPRLSRRQFVGAIASGALATIQSYENVSPVLDIEGEMSAKLIAVNAMYDDESGRVKVTTDVLSNNPMRKLAISYNVSILAELPIQ